MALAVALLVLCGVVTAQAAPVTVKATPNFNPAQGVYSGPKNPNTAVPVTWKVMWDPPMTAVAAVEAAMIPGTDDMFMFIGRFDGDQTTYREYMASTVNLYTGKMRNITSGSNLFCGHLCPTSDGKLLIVGGSRQTPAFTSGMDFLGVYDYVNSPLKLSRSARMAVGRWYPSAVLLPDSTVMIQGGTQTTSEFGPNSKIIERWDPKNPTLTPPKAYMKDADYIAKMGKDFFPLLFVLPTGDVYTQQDQLIRFWNPKTGAPRNLQVTIPAFPADVSNQWPRSGTMLVGPVTYEDNYSSVEVIIMGGTPKSAPCTYGPPGNQIVASRKVYTLKITWAFDAKGEPVYKFPAGKWEVEDMGVPRTGGDGTFTPAGDVILTSGSQRGCHGGSSKGLPRNSYPALWPILYQTDKPKGQRVTVMEATGIARVYHMVAALTRDGHVMVAGCDSCQPSANFKANLDPKTLTWWSPSITGRRDFRTETLQHPFSTDEANRPAIVSVAGNADDAAIVKVSYGKTITVAWKAFKAGAKVDVTGASLVAPSAATHSYNANQRVVKLQIVSKTATTVTLKMPPNVNVAPPQQYLLFLLNGKTNSRSRWVHLQPGM